jgi:hypothetical protein
MQLDEFVLDLGITDVGPRLLKLDIGFASKSSAAGALGGLLGLSWALGSVEVMHMATGARQLFVHNGWVDKSQRRVQLLPRDLGDKVGRHDDMQRAGCRRTIYACNETWLHAWCHVKYTHGCTACCRSMLLMQT